MASQQFLRVKKMFFDSKAVQSALSKAERRILPKLGAIVRRTSRQSLRAAKQKRLSDMTSEERREHYIRTWRAKRQGRKARRPGVPSRPGEPPRLQHPASASNPLRKLIFFGMDLSKRSVVIGPLSFKKRAARDIEDERPFMGPALKKDSPKMASMWRNAVRA